MKEINEYYDCDLFYDKETKVIYYESRYGAITPLYNADGSLKTYDGE